MPKLFSYGTLQQTDVQLATFGRELTGEADALPGFALHWLTITDPDVIRTSGKTEHPLLKRSHGGAPIPGRCFDVTDAELAQADAYEVADYVRIEVTLASGTIAFVYVDKQEAGHNN